MGIVPQVSDLADITSLYHRGYQLIWNEWFRDENLQNSLVVPTGDGPDDPATMDVLLKEINEKIIGLLVFLGLKKGDPVSISLGGSLPVTMLTNLLHPEAGTIPASASDIPSFFFPSSPTTGRGLGHIGGAASAYFGGAGFSASNETAHWMATGISVPASEIINSINATADASAISAITINELRQAALYQQILELDARGGTRYVEAIYSRFGVVSPDFRLQRPELIGQGSSRINVYAVPQTSGSSGTGTPQGNLAAFGTNVISNHGCRYSATEHGMIIGLMNVRADLTYQQCVPRMFTRRSRLEFYEPLLNGLGEQTVFNYEVFASGLPGVDKAAFGYNERFSEYRFKDPMITGKFRSGATGTLDVWHLSQQFDSLPALNSNFITENVPMERVVAVVDEPHFLFESNISYRHTRPMPVRSNPGISRL